MSKLNSKHCISWPFSCVTHNPSELNVWKAWWQSGGQTDRHSSSFSRDRQTNLSSLSLSVSIAFMWQSGNVMVHPRRKMTWPCGDTSHGGCHTEHHNVKKHNSEMLYWRRPSENDSWGKKGPQWSLHWLDKLLNVYKYLSQRVSCCCLLQNPATKLIAKVKFA